MWLISKIFPHYKFFSSNWFTEKFFIFLVIKSIWRNFFNKSWGGNYQITTLWNSDSKPYDNKIENTSFCYITKPQLWTCCGSNFEAIKVSNAFISINDVLFEFGFGIWKKTTLIMELAWRTNTVGGPLFRKTRNIFHWNQEIKFFFFLNNFPSFSKSKSRAI